MSDKIITGVDAYTTAIIANRMDGIVREMTNTLLRAARSAVIGVARDFSCAICTVDNELLASAEALPVHIFGAGLLTQAMSNLHKGDIREGDCYLHNDPYSGNSHAADYVFLVPVFVEGEHLFTAVTKAHQADIGNSQPTTYFAGARDQYEEGALIFPAVRLQRDYKTNQDIVRMGRSRIRVPNQWYGDLLAGIGSVRIAEQRLKELCAKYGKDSIKEFVKSWFDYSEQRMSDTIRSLKAAEIDISSRHDPYGDILPEGIPLNLKLRIDPTEARISIDLRDNIDNVPCGLNMTESTTISAVGAGVFNSIDPSVPRNAGSFRRLQIELRNGAVVGRPEFPHSCSIATTNVSDRLINMTQAAFASIADGIGLAEGGIGMGAGGAVISGSDHRREGGSYVNQIVIAEGTGPGSPTADGWPTYGLPCLASLCQRDSIEVDEQRLPIHVHYLRLLPDTAGAGRFRGAPALGIAYGTKELPMEVIWPCDGTIHPPKGVRGGEDGCRAHHTLKLADGTTTTLPPVVTMTMRKGDIVEGYSCSGGGYGPASERDPERVLKDVIDGIESLERARSVYGVIFSGSVADGTLAVDHEASRQHRMSMPPQAAA
ncbi:hydantoinase B/oxoprolinase family protein [Aminobacter aminovorans]|uniref:Hydantoinase B/oxoprolinase n=1 Tax=Aminobacter aminovorans TaxID=83263 RepID=A0AAC8YVU9_AMIAI|nr:hydantoinase B/oxoprolinase family protein [Aminobacter aminovorans]AMS45461.1 Hydantoinase B/oxoprolinase [Aminobacter aminovorans]MBB3708668.1 N-methylhydantoinase B [Aminobacter aminovorans]